MSKNFDPKEDFYYLPVFDPQTPVHLVKRTQHTMCKRFRQYVAQETEEIKFVTCKECLDNVQA